MRTCVDRRPVGADCPVIPRSARYRAHSSTFPAPFFSARMLLTPITRNYAVRWRSAKTYSVQVSLLTLYASLFVPSHYSLQHMFVLLLFFTTLVGTATSEAAADGKLSAQFFTSAMLMEAVCSTNSTVEAGYALNQSSAPHIPCAPATTPAPAVIGARWDGHLVGLTPGKNYTFGVKTTGAVRFYVHGWKLVGAYQV